MRCLTDRAQKEIWKDIPGWEGIYAVSSLGRVKSYDRMGGGKVRGPYKLRGRLMTQTLLKDNDGCNVMLTHGDRRLTTSVARLVLQTFVGDAPAGAPMAIRRDGNCRNNRLSNLRWGRQQDAEMLKLQQGRDGGFFRSDRVEDIEWRTNKDKKKVSVIT